MREREEYGDITEDDYEEYRLEEKRERAQADRDACDHGDEDRHTGESE